MRVAYFYFMTRKPECVHAVAPRHASYWQGLALDGYLGRPFADESGGLIVFDSDSEEHAERLVAGDPFRREGLLEHHWIKEWRAGLDPTGDAAGHAQTTAESTPRERAEQ